MILIILVSVGIINKLNERERNGDFVFKINRFYLHGHVKSKDS